MLARALDAKGRAEGVLVESGAKGRTAGLLPGELAEVEIEHVQKDGLRNARLVEVKKRAPDRVDPACPHFLTCGGCDFLHASVSFQHRFKRRRLADTLGVEIQKIDEVCASDDSLGYRALVKLVIGEDGTVGSYAPRSHRVVDMSGCAVHHPVGESIAQALRSALKLAEGAPPLRYALIRVSTHSQRAIVTLVCRAKDARSVVQLARALFSHARVARVYRHVNDSEGDALMSEGPSELLLGDAPVTERLGEVTLSLTSGAFNQVNPGAARHLYSRVAQLLKPQGEDLLELYAGSGGLSLQLLAAGAKHVLSAETIPSAVQAALSSAASMGWSSRLTAKTVAAEVMLADAALIGQLRRAPRPVVLNPPRKGLSEPVREAIAALPWRRLVYVSCNPVSLARDLRALQGAHGAEIARVVPVDLFPQTRHIETIVLLTRDGSR